MKMEDGKSVRTKLRVEATGMNDFRVLLPDGSELDGVRKVSIPTRMERTDMHSGPIVAEMTVELDSFFAEAWPRFEPDGLKIAARRLGYQLVPEGTVRFDHKRNGWVMCDPWPA